MRNNLDVKQNIFPKYVEFQTHSFCNSKCLYCPYDIYHKDLSYGYMDDYLFKKIIDECSAYKLERIIPYLNNEPFIDKQYINRIEYIRKRMPDVFIEIASNVQLLTKSIGESLFDLEVNEIRLSVHGLYRDTYEKLMPGLNYDTVFSNIETLLKIREKRGNKTKLVIVVLKAKLIDEVENKKIKEYWKERNLEVYEFEVFNKLGSVPNTYNQFPPIKIKENLSGCLFNRHLERMYILYNGDVQYCCEDWVRKCVAGNLKGKTMFDIWNGVEYKNFRDYLQGIKPASDNFICKRCVLAK